MRMPQLSNGKIDIKSLDLDGMCALFSQIGDTEDRARRVYQQLWQRGIRHFDELSYIAKPTRLKLADIAEITFLETLSVEDSADGTRKFLWKLPSGGAIESVLIPDEDRKGGLSNRMTLCVSSQWGCAMRCSFCLTGDLGLRQQLAASQIANQVLQVGQTLPTGKRITNVVMMGMGEPLHNYKNVITALKNMLADTGLNLSHRKVTVSTVGLIPGLKKLAKELPVNLAISLNATTEEQRKQVMPVTKKYSMAELLEACKEIPLPSGKKITFEYVMMAGFNDSLEDAERLFQLMQQLPSKVNLIPYNENPDRAIRRPSKEHVKSFQHYLVSRGQQCTIRETRGIDISAACGQLGKAIEQLKQLPQTAQPEILEGLSS